MNEMPMHRDIIIYSFKIKHFQCKIKYLEKRKDYNNETVTTARPRRLSEVSIKTAAKPLPKEKAFFLISHTNR